MDKKERHIGVLHILEAMGGGTALHLSLLLPALQQRGVEIRLALPEDRDYDPRNALMDYSFPKKMEEKQIPTVRFPMIHGAVHPWQDFRAVFLLWRYLREEKFDIIHTHSAKAGVLGRVAAFLSSTPVIIHTPYSLPFQNTCLPTQVRNIYWLIEKFLGLITSGMIATSISEFSEISENGIIPQDKINLIGNCFDLDTYTWSTDKRSTVKSMLGWSPVLPVVGTVARLSLQKGIIHLVETAAIIHALMPEVRFVVVGEGDERPNIERKIRDLGLADFFLLAGLRDNYLDYIHAFDVFAFPSLWEGLPYAPIEAMASGTPVVATRVTGSCDLIQDGVTGLLVQPSDPQAMAAAIMSLIKDTSLASRLIREARIYVEQHFNILTPVEQTLNLYLRLLPQKAF